MSFLLWIPFLIALVVYCYFEKKNSFNTATTLKVLLSAFVAIVAVFAAIKINSIPAFLFSVGLIFAVPADFFLQYIKSNLKKYRVGIFFFGAMHICLIVSMIMGFGIGWVEFAIFVAFLIILLAFQKSEKWQLGKVEGQLSLYTVLVIFMAAKAISVFISAPSISTMMLGIGGLFFFVSDLFLGIWDYHSDRFLFLALNRIVYFVGQLSLAFYLLLSV